MLRGQHREHDQQPAVHLARLELCGGRARDADALAVQQLRARGPARGQVGRHGPLVGGGPARGSGADLDQAGPGPEAGQQHALLPGARSARSGRSRRGRSRRDNHVDTRRTGPDRHQPARGDPARAQRGAHERITPDRLGVAQLAGYPGGGLRPHGPGGPPRPGGRHRVRTGRRSRPGRRPADLDDAHHRRGRDHHADGQDQRQPRMPQPGRPAPDPQADGRREHPAPRRSSGQRSRGGRTHRLPGLRTGQLPPNPVRPHCRVIWDSRAHTQAFIYRNA